MTEPFEPHYRTGPDLTAGWTPPARPERESVKGRYCHLEPLAAEQHLDDLWATLQKGDDTLDWLYLPWGPFDTRDGFAAWMQAFCTKDDPLFSAILDAETGKAIGFASLLNINPGMATIEVGAIHYSPALQRSPAATEAMYLMMRQSFDLGYRRYEWKCDSMNQRSRRAAQRLGLSYEGVFRQHMVVKGRNRDTAWYAAIDSEWPALKQAFETWLVPANFDGDGNQRQRLSDLTAPILKARG